ncbi:ATP-binding protein [Gloeocapsopsis sp. IPPAS B-1203]|uniref:ATP-binding protein n=1 Tax=Gloeocapsopsis sp. IPPAS B-1203 TaxID=2049454 RepID=UPI000C18CC73|nr:ATP-binding protein [Gloeocapsopsis sp. IPPAS B-1203]PIG94439.1 hybrid sensor histidine kinase/response regulator [Gloeocapsopsis sp. IPPAS B-1203]
MPNPELYDFITTIPSCRETTQLKVVLEILQQTQCDRLIVVNEEQVPIGILSAAQLLLYLYSKSQTDTKTIHQAISTVDPKLIEQIVVLPATLKIEELGLHLQSLPQQNTHCVLVDPAGKLLGLLDRVQLSEFLCLNFTKASSEAVKQVSDRQNQLVLDLLVQLLEKLPCPLILQTTTGEVVMQNSAWSRHFGGFSDPEEVRRKVESILDSATVTTQMRSSEQIQNSEVVATVANRYHNNAAISLHTQQLLSISQKTDEYDAVNISDYIPSLEPDEFMATANRCQLGTQSNTCICIWTLPNGQERVWEFVKIPLQEQYSELDACINDTEQKLTESFSHLLPMSPNLWLLLATDVTEQQQLALELAAKNADLIQLNRLKDEFLSCISHELKTPLTAVLGLSTLLKDQALGELNERQSRYAKLIHQSGRHLMSVVNDILDLTRMETGQLKLSIEQVNISNICDRALEQVRVMQARDSQASVEAIAQTELEHRFTLEIEPGLDTLVADELRLRQMLVHLLANAFKFTETGGEIGLRVNRWAGWIAFTIWDTGIGIPEQQQHLIFQKFQQLENPLTRRFKGTGLGLVLTRALARLHGGDVSFLSKEGRGSSFTLLLPPHPPTDFRLSISEEELQNTNEKSQILQRNSKAKTQNLKLSNRLVLLVEAAPRYIAYLTEQLGSLGYRVVNARSGTEALEKARRLQPGIIFLNPLLPLLSGWDVLTLLKSDSATRQIPVVVTTTRAEKEQALANRADECINLPVPAEILPQILARFCQEPIANSETQAIGTTKNCITILRLVGGESLPLIPKSPIHYRILEADDLEQAEILVSIWQPDVVLLDGAIAEPIAYLKSLSQFSKLAALPIVTLDTATTQAANQIEGLAVFPCLLPTDKRDPETLLSVLQFAAGMQWKPNILVVDVATLPDLQPKLSTVNSLAPGTEWFQALIPYLETAGFKGTISHSWVETLTQIRQGSVDLILICLADVQLNSDILQALQNLENEDLPPILVLNGQLHSILEPHRENLNHSSDLQVTLDRVLQGIATEILPPSLSIQELLDKIIKTLALNASH